MQGFYQKSFLIISSQPTQVFCEIWYPPHRSQRTALEDILAQVADTLVDWTPNEDQSQAIVNYKNLRLKNLARYKDGGDPLDFYQLINLNGRPTIQPSLAPSTAHTATHRTPKKKDAPGPPVLPVSSPASPLAPEAQPVAPPTKPVKLKRKITSFEIHYGEGTSSFGS
ncbi:hypothetical protein OUZ56_007155 [Daphnia magna]|uniref:Uncharacterized protein n=1 Tax=Daphnia magna TaxID=35525 RepID=A0ABQ9YXR2_9CRUS|nr:hypothetical protein OUZ56_007155 [Daphnia magna]